MTDFDTPRDILLTQIAEVASSTTNSSVLLKLAEAFAWVYYPNQAHGGSVVLEK